MTVIWDVRQNEVRCLPRMWRILLNDVRLYTVYQNESRQSTFATCCSQCEECLTIAIAIDLCGPNDEALKRHTLLTMIELV